MTAERNPSRGEVVFGRLGGSLLGLGAFCLALVLAARVFHPGGGDVDSPGADSFSRSALGHRALVELVERAGPTVVVSRFAPLAELGPEVGLLVLEPPLEMDGDELAFLVSDALDLGARVVVVLPKRRWVQDPKRPGWIAGNRLVSTDDIEWKLDDLVLALEWSLEVAGLSAEDAGGFLRVRRLKGERGPRGWVVDPSLSGERPELDRLQVLVPADDEDPHGFEPLVETDAGMLVARHRQLPLVIVSDPDLVATHGLGRGDNAVLALSLLLAGGERAWVVDETLHGFERTPALFRGLLEPPLLPVTVHLALLTLLALWLATLRFGAPERPAPVLARGSEVLVENTARLLELGRSEPETLERYLRMSVARVAGRLGVTGKGRERLGRLARIGRARRVTDDPRRLAARVDEMIAAGGRTSPARRRKALELARRIARWRREMTR